MALKSLSDFPAQTRVSICAGLGNERAACYGAGINAENSTIGLQEKWRYQQAFGS